MEVRDITNSKILQHICQIWLKLADLAKSAAKSAVSRGRKRLIESHQKQTNKQKFMFLSWTKVYHDMLAFCFLTQPEPIRTKQGRNGKLSETFQTKSSWDLAHELSRSINWSYQNWFMCPNYFHSSNPFRCIFLPMFIWWPCDFINACKMYLTPFWHEMELYPYSTGKEQQLRHTGARRKTLYWCVLN